MIFRFGGFTVDVDVEKTKQFYEASAQTLTEGCDCIACQNFVKASKNFPMDVRSFFAQLGVDVCKAPDMSAMYGEQERQVLHYWGFYHLCGSILAGDNPWVADSPESSHWDPEKAYEVAPGCRVGFTERCALTEDGFPAPVIQMEVEMEVAWLLEEQHYLLT